MEQEKRIKRVIDWLVFQGLIDSQNDLAARLGYSKSYMSQALHGHEKLSAKFANKLCSFDENINSVWLMTGEGEMFKNNPFSVKTDVSYTIAPVSEDVVINGSIWEELKRRDKQVDDLISMLRDSLDELKKTHALPDGLAECADAG